MASPQLSRISTALVRAQDALNVSDASVHDLEHKIADTKHEISAISSKINSLRKEMALKYELQENLEDLLPLAVHERERATNRVNRLQHALAELERHLTAEDWYEEEEMEQFATGQAADKYEKYLIEVGRASPQDEDPLHIPISQRVLQLTLDPSFQAGGLNTIDQDIRLVSAPEAKDISIVSQTATPVDRQIASSPSMHPEVERPVSFQVVPSYVTPSHILQPRNLIDFEESQPHFPEPRISTHQIPQSPIITSPCPSSPATVLCPLDVDAERRVAADALAR
ncbi:hypothetical protein FRB90_004534 [Tulasnella sp. 427]|nr:hypothetical protein FRB90_004534 [Tulasnella sp. 427]